MNKVNAMELSERKIKEALANYPLREDAICLHDFIYSTTACYIVTKEKIAQKEKELLWLLKNNGFRWSVKKVFLEYDFSKELRVSILGTGKKEYTLFIDKNNYNLLRGYYSTFPDKNESDEGNLRKLYKCIKSSLKECIELFEKLPKKNKMVLQNFHFLDEGRMKVSYKITRFSASDEFSFNFIFFLSNEETLNVKYVIDLYKGILGYKNQTYTTSSDKYVKKILEAKYEGKFLYKFALPKRIIPEGLIK